MNIKQSIKTLLLLFGAMLGGANANATITGIQFFMEPSENREAEIAFQRFIPGGDPAAHFFLPTGVVGENVFGGGSSNGMNGIAWWDIIVAVQRDTTMEGEDAIISIDKVPLNLTGIPWYDFHMTLGQATGRFFTESSADDGLFFQHDPTPVEGRNLMDNNPSNDIHNYTTFSFDRQAPQEADNLWWAGGNQLPGTSSDFWVSINIPDNMFNPSGFATFTIRQHATIPEPTALALLAIGLAGLGFTKRRRY